MSAYDQIFQGELQRYQLDKLHDGPPSAKGWDDWARTCCPDLHADIERAAAGINQAKDSRTPLGRYRQLVREWARLLREGMKAYLWLQAPSTLKWSPPPDDLTIRVGVFDLESEKSAQEVKGWGNIHLMGLTFAGVYDVLERDYRVFGPSQAQALIDHLLSFDLVVGFNHVGFDYVVLRPYRDGVVFPPEKQLDLMVDLECHLHRRPSLEAMAKGTCGSGKFGDGLAAIRWYAQRELEKLFVYLEGDVWNTYELWLHGYLHGHVRWSNPHSPTGATVSIPTDHWRRHEQRTQYSGQLDLFGDVQCPVNPKRVTNRHATPGSRS